MSPTDRNHDAAAPKGSPALLAALLLLILAGLAVVHLRVGAPDVARQKQLQPADGSLQPDNDRLLSVPPRIQDLLDANRPPEDAAQSAASTEFLEFMSRRAQQAHLKLQSITPGAHESSPVRVRTQAVLHMTGNYPEVLVLLTNLARGKELIAVDYIHLKRDTEHGQGLIIELWVSRLWVNPEVSA